MEAQACSSARLEVKKYEVSHLILFWLISSGETRRSRLRRSNRSQLSYKQLNTNCSDSGVNFTLTSSENDGGVDIDTGSGTIHAPKSSSEHHTSGQFLQFAIRSNDVDGDKFSSSKSTVPKITAATVKSHPSSASPNVQESDWLPPNPMPGSPKVEFNPVETFHRDSVASFPVLSTASSTQQDSTSIMDDDAEIKPMPGAPTAAGADSVDRVRHSSSKSRSNGAPAINSSDSTSQIPVAHDGTNEESEHQSDPNPCVGERGISEKTKRRPVIWYMATAAVHHLTGNREIFITFQEVENTDLCVYAADGRPMRVCGSGNVDTGTVALSGVWYVPGLDVNLVSVGQLAELDYRIGFARGSCTISSADSTVVGSAHASGYGLYEVDFLQLPLGMA